MTVCSITFFPKSPSDKHKVSYYISCKAYTKKGLPQIYNALPRTDTELQGSAKAVFLLVGPRRAFNKQIKQDQSAASKWLSTTPGTGQTAHAAQLCNLILIFVTEQRCLKSLKKNYQTREETEWVFFVCLFVCLKTVSCFLIQTHKYNGIKCVGGVGQFFLEENIMLPENSLTKFKLLVISKATLDNSTLTMNSHE